LEVSEVIRQLFKNKEKPADQHLTVGMLRRRNKPSKSARAAAVACSHYGINFFYFRPQDVNFDTKKINGFFLVKAEWVQKKVDYPIIVDNSLPSNETLKLHEELERHCILTTHRIGTKSEIYEMLERDGTFKHILIPYRMVRSKKEIDDFLSEHKEVILKPSQGNQGKNIYEIEKSQDGYILHTDRKSDLLSEKEMINMAEKQFAKRKYLVQPFIKSRTKEDHPFDIRIHTRRAENGVWKWITLLPRIGMSNAITSNVNQGGAVSETDSFLEVQFGAKAPGIKKELINIAENLPPCIQQFYDFPIDSLGIDIGVEQNGDMWFFEVNTSPGTKFYELEIGEARAQYYEYLEKSSAKIPEADSEPKRNN
jgi:glutathione synthase/RimK-type ligase-like ATP-grasp enzyme